MWRRPLNAFLKERIRALGSPCDSPDSSYISGANNAFADTLSPDECKYLEVFYLLANFTEMRSYKDSVVSGIVPPDNVVVDRNQPSGFLSFDSVFPNPTNSVANISYNLPRDGLVNIALCDMFGREVFNQNQVGRQGQNVRQINMSGYASGTYFYRLNYITNGLLEPNKFTWQPITVVK